MHSSAPVTTTPLMRLILLLLNDNKLKYTALIAEYEFFNVHIEQGMDQ